MFSYEGHFYDSYQREPSLKRNVVFPIKKPTNTQGRAESFMNDIRPIMEICRLLGQYPLHMKDTGNNIYHPERKVKINLVQQNST